MSREVDIPEEGKDHDAIKGIYHVFREICLRSVEIKAMHISNDATGSIFLQSSHEFFCSGAVFNVLMFGRYWLDS